MPCDFVVKNASKMRLNCFGSSPGPEFAGGTLIPTVFAAVFILFRPRTQGIGTIVRRTQLTLAAEGF